MGPLCKHCHMEPRQTNRPSCSSTSPQSSYPSLSSETDANQQTSSGYSSENHPQETEKQLKKKRIQECLREIKNLISQQSQEAPTQKLETVDALSRVLDLLRQQQAPSDTQKSEKTDDTLTASQSGAEFLVANSAIFEDSVHDLNDLHLGTFSIDLPSGAITSITKLDSELCEEESLIGSPLLDLVTEADRYLLSSCVFRPVVALSKQSLFARLSNVRFKRAVNCELLCTISSDVAKVSFSQLKSAFSEPKQRLSGQFCTRHSINGRFTFIEPSGVHLCGFLPQHLLGHSIFGVFHQNDVSTVCHAHEQLMVNKSRLIKTKPCRFLCQNGQFILVETEWSLFLNPWTQKVDFIIGCHHVLEGPQTHPDVFEPNQTDSSPDLLPAKEISELEKQLASICLQAMNLSPTKAKPSPKPSKMDSLSGCPTAEHEILGHKALKRRDLGAYVDSIVENMVLTPGPKDSVVNKALNLATSGGSPEQGSGGAMSTGSPPESSSSGQLSYTQINCLENVQRLLQSQPTTHISNEDSNSPQRHEKSSSGSPLEESQRHMHRSHSAYELEPMPLTRELLQQHTKTLEKEYKENWKRRYSDELSRSGDYSPLKRALESQPQAQEELFYPQKMLRMDFHRPASMPLLAKPLPELWTPGFLPPKGADYYRALGPNPPPPPGRNFQITSAPLPTTMQEQFGTSPPRKSAFAPPQRKTVEFSNEPINLSFQEQRTQRSVIQPSPLVQQLSAIPHQQNPLAAGGRPEMGPPWMSGVPLNEDLFLRYQQAAPENAKQILARDHQRLLAMQQPNLINQQLEKVYSELQSTQISQPLEQSPVKEATDALMLLQET